MSQLTQEQHALFRQIDDKTKWAVAAAYRAERQKGESDYPARWAAIRTFEQRCPATVAAIIVVAARDHSEWFNKGVGDKPFKPTI